MVQGDDNAEADALRYHSRGRPGKLEVIPSKPMSTQRDLALAYSPGVAVPVRKIAENPEAAYDFTGRGNLVAVITNGTAILGLGALGPLASKPVMEGKAALFKRFADINAVDLEIEAEDPDAFVNAVRYLGPSFGGINLEDISSPHCFEIEERLKELMDIPVFHDDQHGTAIICLAALFNALDLANKKLADARIVLNGAGAAGIACLDLIKACGAQDENCLALDIDGVLYPGRAAPMNRWQARHAVATEARDLNDAIQGADVFLGLSAKDVLTPDMLSAMAESPVVFAMANPDPEIDPELAQQTRPDAIIATGRSDYPNQVNNVLGFPYIFRGALDVRARQITDEMKIAAAQAIAELAREDVPDEVASAYGRRPDYGRGYIIPAPFDPRLLHRIPPAVARAAMEGGVAQGPIVDFEQYENRLRARLDPTASILQRIHDVAATERKRVVFAEGSSRRIARAALAYVRDGLGQAVVLGQEADVRDRLRRFQLRDEAEQVEVIDPEHSPLAEVYTQKLFERLQRDGFHHSDCYYEVRTNRHTFGACMVENGDIDAMVTGATRKPAYLLGKIELVFGRETVAQAVGISIVVTAEGPVLIADTLGHELPVAEELVGIATTAADTARRFGITPRVAFLSFSTFGHPVTARSVELRKAVEILERNQVDFEFDGEMAADVALVPETMSEYPFCRLSGPANVLVMPARHSASISTLLLQHLAGNTVIGPVTAGMDTPIQICSTGSTVSDILNMAMLAASRFC